MAKGGKGGSVFNGPSTTGNPSGKGRGNNASRSSGNFGFTGGSITVSSTPLSGANLEADLRYKAMIARMDADVRQTHEVARAIRTAREALPAAEASSVEAELRAKLRPQQSVMVSSILRSQEYDSSKSIRGKS